MTTRSDQGAVSRRDALLALGYQPLRYRGMARPGDSAKEILTRAVKATAAVVPNPTVGEP